MGSKLIAGALVAATALAPATADARTWYVRAGASEAGDGSRAAPFASLGRVEAASRRGDRIVVLGADRALAGGIRLKSRQRLIGSGASARLTNLVPIASTVTWSAWPTA